MCWCAVKKLLTHTHAWSRESVANCTAQLQATPYAVRHQYGMYVMDVQWHGVAVFFGLENAYESTW